MRPAPVSSQHAEAAGSVLRSAEPVQTAGEGSSLARRDESRLKRRTARERAAGRPSTKKLFQELRIRILRRDDSTCVYCGWRATTALEVLWLVLDHVVPLARGGTYDDANLATACAECNSRKGVKPVEEFLLAFIGEA